MAPLIKAAASPGADVYASGTQKWKGTSVAFMPEPGQHARAYQDEGESVKDM